MPLCTVCEVFDVSPLEPDSIHACFNGRQRPERVGKSDVNSCSQLSKLSALGWLGVLSACKGLPR